MIKKDNWKTKQHTTTGSAWLLIFCFLSCFQMAHAAIVGKPPITEISIPSEPYMTIFDMAQDHNNVIYLSYDEGVKIFDGNQWQTLLIPNTYLTRVLYFDQKDRIYVGGYDFFGYINRNQFGHFEFINLTPIDKHIPFASIWGITACNNLIYFRALNQVFSYAPQSGDINSWSFNAKLGAIQCIENQVLLQDRTAGMKVLVNNQWLNSEIHLEDNSLIYELEVLQNNNVFIRSLSDDWRIIKENTVQVIEFASNLPELGTFSSSLVLNDNQMVMGSKDGTLTFFDFNTLSTKSFQLSSDWISSIIKSNDGGLLILSNFTIYHLSWPSPWRIQGHETGLSSDIFDLSTWNNQLYATSRAGVFVENNKPTAAQYKNFNPLNWTNQEAWDLFPVNDSEMLLAESHYVYLIKDEQKTMLTEVIYPRVFIPSKFIPNHIYLQTEFDTRLLVKNGNSWSDWVVAEGKPSSVVEVSSDTLLISDIDGRIFKVLLNEQLNAVEATIELNSLVNIPSEEIDELLFFEGPNHMVLAANNKHYYQFENNELIKTDLFGLSKKLPPIDLSMLGTSKNGTLWAFSATKVFILDQKNNWLTIDASAYINGGINDIELSTDQLKLSANSMILTYLFDQAKLDTKVTGHMLITAAKMNTPNDEVVDIPINSTPAFSMGPNSGSLTIDYSFTDIINPSATLYQYRLQGLNKQWSPYSKNTQANFLKLPSGDYTFEVRAKDINGISHTSQALAFYIEPTWYRTTTASIIWVLGFILLSLYMIKRLILWRERKHEEQKQALKAIINDKTHALKLANQALQDLAHNDSLTGLSNRLYLDKFINKLINNKVNHLAVIMMDIDHFKQYNDSHGHLAGDKLLEKFSKLLLANMKDKQSLVARYGGEEFLIIIPKPNHDYIATLAESIRLNTEEKFPNTTISIGFTFSSNEVPVVSAKHVFDLIDQADQALYAAKSNGRNQVVEYQDLVLEK